MDVPQKIVLKSTTKLSLNDRFTQIARTRPDPAVMAIRAKMATNANASAKNRRLALQMANRPSVKAALGQPQRAKQRLGVQARLGLPGRGRGRGGGIRGGGVRGGALAGRLGSPRGMTNVNRGQRGRGIMRGLGRGRGGSFGRGGQSVSRGGGISRGVSRGGGLGRGGLGRGGLGRGGLGRGGGGRGRGQGQRGRGQRGGGRGQRGGRGGARGAGRQAPSREDLDLQLDAYMAGSDNNAEDWS